MQGKIMKGIGGFYYVYGPAGLVECRAKGIFRKDKIKPLVGDNVEIEIEGSRRCPTDRQEKSGGQFSTDGAEGSNNRLPVDSESAGEAGDCRNRQPVDGESAGEESALPQGNIVRILPRKNALVRPASANIDQALVIFAVTRPDPNYNLLDRFLITMERLNLPVAICFNKKDIATEREISELEAAYSRCGYQVLFVSGREKEGMDELRQLLSGKTTVMAGPSGVGKSTIMNTLCPQAQMETGEISPKIQRGRHTTRHAQLFALDEETFIMDTPGFTSLYIEELEKEELRECYPEFLEYESGCRFRGCAHIKEPDCGVKEALSTGRISRIRYDNYVLLYEELKNRKRY